MNEERTSCTGNDFHTEITHTTQCLLAFFSAFERMGPFVPGALVKDRVIRGLLRLKKRCLRESPTTHRLAHAPLPMPWVQISRLSVSYTHLRAHETPEHLVCRLLLV